MCKGVAKGIDGIGDAAVGGIFNGDNAVICMAAFDFMEDGGDRLDRGIAHRIAKFEPSSLVGVGASFAKMADGDGLLEGDGGGHDFPPDGAQGFDRAVALVIRTDPSKNIAVRGGGQKYVHPGAALPRRWRSPIASVRQADAQSADQCD